MFGFFRSKKEFDKAVKEEVDRREKENEKRWEEWLKKNPVEVKLGKKNELNMLYVKAEEMYKKGECLASLEILNSVIKGLVEIGETIGLYVFILLIDVRKALEGSDGALDAYDMGIKYYGEISGEQACKWKEHLIVAKESYIEEERMLNEMRTRYKFSLDASVIPALQRLEGIAVSKYIDCGGLDSFDEVWREVLKQVDNFEQGKKEQNNLNKTTYKGAKNWLKHFSHLCKNEIPDEYKTVEG